MAQNVMHESSVEPGAHLKWWAWLGDSMEILKVTFYRQGFGLAMYAVTTAVLVFVPQIAEILWKLPYRIAADNLLNGVGFWIYVPLLAFFFYGSWVMLARTSGLGVSRLVSVTCGYVLVLLLLAPAADSLWNDLFGNSIGAAVAFYLLVPILSILYCFSWFFLSRPDDCWDEKAQQRGFAAWYLKQRARLWPDSARSEDASEEPAPSHAFLSSGWARFLLILAIPMACVNLLLLALNYVFCGFWVGLLALSSRRHPGLTLVAALVATALVFTGYWTYWQTEETGLYPGSHGVFGLILMPMMGLCVWIAAVAWHHPGGDAEKLLDPVGEVSGRILVLLLTVSLFGEFLWASASTPFLDQFISYRLYTIWAAFHLSFGLVSLGTWADVTQRDWKQWPMRVLTLATLVVIVLTVVTATALDRSGQKAGSELWEAQLNVDKVPGASFNWYKHVWDRLEAIDKKGQGPIVVVAASGGGSRAALFTALVLEGLGSEPFPSLTGNSWADRTLFISGVSGGSLATAHVAFRQGPATTPFLRNTMQSELLTRFDREYDSIKVYYADDKLKKLKRSFADLYRADNEELRDPDLRWMLASATADDMCTDFMAPLFRGVLTFREERGHAVSRFWQQRFGWLNPADGKPYHNLSHDPARPLIVFNATDARHGNRFLLGFPQLPRRTSTMHLGRIPYATITVEGAIAPGDSPNAKYANQPTKVHLVRMREGNSYTLDMKRNDDTADKEKPLDSFLIIEDPQGEQTLAKDDDSGGEFNARISDFIAPASGDYRVLASAFGPGRGDYTLTVRQNHVSSPIIAQTEEGTFSANLPYTQALADFWPCYRLEAAQAVRASANFPWGFQSCYLTRSSKKYDFKKEALRKGLAQHAEKLLHLLPLEHNLLGLKRIPNTRLQVDGKGVANLETTVKDLQEKMGQPLDDGPLEKQVQAFDQIARSLEQLTLDAHAPKAFRDEARKVLADLEAIERPKQFDEKLFLLDGGVNDNTGIPTLVELFQHLESVATIEDPLLDPDNKRLAIKIMKHLRERGMIFLEIDSGAKPKSTVLHDLQTPLQAMENANFVNASIDRERYLKRINKLLTPASHQKEGPGKGIKKLLMGTDSDASKKSGPWDLPWVFHHLFLCNHSNDRDVMTAWALSPGDKARVMATYFCEYQKWRKEQSADIVGRWLAARDKELHPETKSEDMRKVEPLSALGTEMRDNDQRRSEQQANILKSQKTTVQRE